MTQLKDFIGGARAAADSTRTSIIGLLLVLIFAFSPGLVAQGAGFDLSGPPVDVRVERAGKTLPISEVPNLEAGDRLWIHADLPESQSARYWLIVAFLRGATNPPPDQWFTKVPTWIQPVRQEGVFVTVPAEAQQALIFLAPETAGDFSTLRAAVRGRPGAFVRAAQDLQQASLDRMRLDRYLEGVKSASDTDPAELQRESLLLARSLKIKLDARCFDRPAEQQASCLTQNSEQLVLDDAHSQSTVAQLANGATADLMHQISYSQIGGGGAYSAYVGAVVDFARIMGSMHSAQYQYIPALAVPHLDSLSLKLNNPPSFRKPKSVLVVALPPVQKVRFPPLRPVGVEEPYCIQNPSLLLPVEGAPLVFATQLSHEMVLHFEDASGESVDLRAEANAGKGGLSIDTHGTERRKMPIELIGTVRGLWGFDPFQGPQFKFESAHPQSWSVPPGDSTALVVGREDTLHLSGQHSACVDEVSMRGGDGEKKKVPWKLAKGVGLAIRLPLEHRPSGPVTLEVSQYGLTKPDEITLETYAEAAQFDRFQLNIADQNGILEGKRLDEVASLELAGIPFEPGDLNRRNNKDELKLHARQQTDSLVEGQFTAQVRLKDGRSFALPGYVLAPRPKVALISKGVQTQDNPPSLIRGGQTQDNLPLIRLGSDNDLPLSGRIVFFVKTLAPSNFSRAEKIEVAATDDSFRTMLSMADGNLVLQDPKIALGILDPEKTFGVSAFGPIRFRPVDASGRTGDWQPLGTLVRLPVWKELHCPVAATKTCVLTGENLFLLTALAADPNFEQQAVVPDGFTEQRLEVPHLAGSSLYFKLRDDPEVVHTVTMPIVRGAPPSQESSARGADPQK